MTAPARARTAPAPGATRARAAPSYDHFDLACARCGMGSWSCSQLEASDDRPFPLGRCCSACGEFDVHNVLGGEPVGRGSRELWLGRERPLSSTQDARDQGKRGLNVLPIPNLG